MGYRCAVDIGGTFTDLVVFDTRTLATCIFKSLSTPHDFTAGVMDCLKKFKRSVDTSPEIDFIAHATTVATNTLLESKGARVALITTKGFKGVYEIGSLLREEDQVYNLFYQRPELLVRARHIYEVDERIDRDGIPLKALEVDDVRRLSEPLAKQGIEAIAVCLLFSFRNATHEASIKRLLRESLGDHVYVSISSEILPEIREYKRMSTTVVDAYIGPTIKAYLGRLEERLRENGITTRPYIMHSGGGTMTVESAKDKAVWLIESGPAAGVIASSYLGALLGLNNVMTFDMGGTTAKAGLVVANVPRITTEFKAGGQLIGVPVIDLVEIGAGGGSIARVDGGFLRVGPQSAGAAPGPVCYGLGGAEPTVTDANVALGYYNPDFFLGGEMLLDREGAIECIRKNIGEPLNMPWYDAAAGIRKVVNASMAESLREVSIKIGYDPRDFAIIAFGGSGPAHACDVVREVGCKTVIIPAIAGVFSAWGLLNSDVRYEYVHSDVRDLAELNDEEIRGCLAGLVEVGRQQLLRDGFPPDQQQFVLSLDLRYEGQGYELNIPVPQTDGDFAHGPQEIRRSFEDEHERSFGHRARNQRVEVVSYRIAAIGVIPRTGAAPIGSGPVLVAPKGYREAYFDGGFVNAPVYDRRDLAAGAEIKGPAIVEQMDSSAVICPGDCAFVDAFGNIIVEMG